MKSLLAIYNNSTAPTDPTLITNYSEIGEQLSGIGVRFEKWKADQPLSDDANQEEVLAVYASQVEALKKEYQFQSVDVVALRPDHPEKGSFREKFLSEHTHDDFEVRFFVDGTGLFYLKVEERVYVVFCTAGDLISVPANTTHWFDMGSEPSFKCIRFFTIPEGWVGNFTGSDIARSYPDCDAFVREFVK